MKIKNVFKVILLLISVGYINTVLSQTAFSEQNSKYIDSVEYAIKHIWCNDLLTYPAEYKKKKIQSDMKIVEIVNHIFKKDFTAGSLDEELVKVQKLKVSRSETKNGLIKVISIIVTGNYLRTELTLECIDELVIRKKSLLFSNSRGKCPRLGYTIDFNLIKRYFIRELDFLIRVWDNEYFVATDFNLDNIKIASGKHNEFTFNIPGSASDEWVNKILYNQYNSDSSCCYLYSKANKNFVELIRHDKIKVIKDLLFSPNYFYSVHAMEALIYLASINKIVIDDAMKERIATIKQSNYNISVKRTDDVFGTVIGYNALSVTDAGVVQKYKNAFK